MYRGVRFLKVSSGQFLSGVRYLMMSLVLSNLMSGSEVPVCFMKMFFIRRWPFYKGVR